MPIKKNKQSRLLFIGEKLKTPKGRLFATILIFAAIGGGILVFKSFASTGIMWSYVPSNGTLAVTKNIGDCTPTPVTETDANGKNPRQVINVACKPNARGGTNLKISAIGSYIDNVGAAKLGKQYRACAMIKGSKGSLNSSGFHSINLVLGYPAGNGQLRWTTKSMQRTDIVLDNGYLAWCTPPATLSIAGQTTIELTFAQAGTYMNVQSINLERVN